MLCRVGVALGLQEVVEKQRRTIVQGQEQPAQPAGKRRLAAVSASVDSIQALHVGGIRCTPPWIPQLPRTLCALCLRTMRLYVHVPCH